MPADPLALNAQATIGRLRVVLAVCLRTSHHAATSAVPVLANYGHSGCLRPDGLSAAQESTAAARMPVSGILPSRTVDGLTQFLGFTSMFGLGDLEDSSPPASARSTRTHVVRLVLRSGVSLNSALREISSTTFRSMIWFRRASICPASPAGPGRAAPTLRSGRQSGEFPSS